MPRPAALAALVLSIGCGSAQPARSPEAPREEHLRAAAERLLARRSIAALTAMPMAQREEELFGALYNELERNKPRPMDGA